MTIRHYIKGEEKILREIFYSAIHMNAKSYYNQEQLKAWGPKNYDLKKWEERIKNINPFVLIENETIVGYADLQDDGYIDHFFIRGGYNNKGYGTFLLKYIIETAKERKIKKLESYVSLSAQKLFINNGFDIIKRNKVSINNQILKNSLMRVSLDK